MPQQLSVLKHLHQPPAEFCNRGADSRQTGTAQHSYSTSWILPKPSFCKHRRRPCTATYRSPQANLGCSSTLEACLDIFKKTGTLVDQAGVDLHGPGPTGASRGGARARRESERENCGSVVGKCGVFPFRKTDTPQRTEMDNTEWLSFCQHWPLLASATKSWLQML